MRAERKRLAPTTTERYLWLRGDTWWFRYAVPTRYRCFENRTTICRSTGSRDRHRASIIAAGWRAELHAKWTANDQGPTESATIRSVEPTILDLQVVATEAAFTNVCAKLERLRSSKTLSDNASFEAYYGSLQDQLTRLLRTRDGDSRAMWKGLADRQIAKRGWRLDEGSEHYDLFVTMIAEAGIEAIRLDITRNGKGVPEEPASKHVQEGLKGKADRAAPDQQIMVLFERYATQRMGEGRKRLDTINQDRKVVHEFAEFLGATRSVNSIRKEEVRDWRNAVAASPANFRKCNALKGLTLRQAAERASDMGLASRSPTTVSKYTSTVSPFLAWCVSEGYADANPCDGLHYKPDKKRNARPTYDDDTLRKIFSSPLFAGYLSDGKEHVPGSANTRDWRYWIPLICLFTGARIGEIAQLQVRDVTDEYDIPTIHIRHDPKAGQSTKSGRSRAVPVHPQLIAAGFLAFVNKRKLAGGGQTEPLFMDIEAGDRAQIGTKPSRFWRKYLSRIGIKNGGDGVGAHSFRHTIADRLRAAGYLDNQIAILLGHSQQSVTAGYGRIPQGTIRMLAEMLGTLTFPLDIKLDD